MTVQTKGLYEGWHSPWGKPWPGSGFHLHPYRKHPSPSPGPCGPQSPCLDSHWRLWQLEQTMPCAYPHPVIHRWAQHRPQAARLTSMACSVDNKTACFQHTNVIPDRILQPFLNHGVMELRSLRSVGLTAFRATETMPHARQNCVYTREYSAAHMTQATCVWL